MSETVWLIGSIVWLGLGGWAFSVLAKDATRDEFGPMLGFCVVLAPFAAGLAVGSLTGQNPGQRSGDEDEQPEQESTTTI